MDGEEVDPMMMDLVEGERRLGNEQMEHSVDPPFSARLTGGRLIRELRLEEHPRRVEAHRQRPQRLRWAASMVRCKPVPEGAMQPR